MEDEPTIGAWITVAALWGCFVAAAFVVVNLLLLNLATAIIAAVVGVVLFAIFHIGVAVTDRPRPPTRPEPGGSGR